MVNAGFPEDKIGNDISVFDGLGAHVNQVAQPKRPGLKKPETEGKTYLLVDQDHTGSRGKRRPSPSPRVRLPPPRRPAAGPRAVPPPAAAAAQPQHQPPQS